MTPASSRRTNRRVAAGLCALTALAIAAVGLAAGCGGSSTAATSTSGGRTVQILASVRRGDLVDSAIGRVQLISIKGKAKAVVQVIGQNAAQVAVGQSVMLAFFRRPTGVGQGGYGQGNGSGQSNGSGQGYGYGQGNAQGGAPGSGQNGQGFIPPSGQGFFGQGGQGAFRGGKTTQGTVTSVQQGSNGSVTATIAIAKLPAGVTAKSMGIAQIQVKVLASNVLILPTAAIKGSGGSATVQLLANGKTSTHSVTIGHQTQTESEIVSGLSAGENVVYTRTFTGHFPGARSGQPGGQGYPQNGATPSGIPFGGTGP
jgi:hypothetical protein